MKIAIATMSRDISFGGNLQAYALQKTILEISNSTCVHIAREPKTHKIFIPIRSKRNILTNINRLLHYGNHKRKMQRFEYFQEHYISFTEKVYDENSIHELNNQFDWFVTGSDQVWNCATGINDILFLNFANENKMRVSYAASIGLANIPERQKKGFIDSVSKYDYVSVREKRAKEIVETLTDQRCEQVLDPVFLRDSEEWRNMAGPRIVDEKYIFVYATQVSDELVKSVQQCEKLTGYKVISVHKLLNYPVIEFKSGPLEFLNYVCNAEYVITSSFHCAAFSLIFSKNLTVIPHRTTGVRVTGLLETLGAEKSIYNGEFVVTEKYDANKVNANINCHRERSLKFLEKIIRSGEQLYG